MIQVRNIEQLKQSYLFYAIFKFWRAGVSYTMQ